MPLSLTPAPLPSRRPAAGDTRPAATHGASIRWHLAALGAAILLPVLLLAGYLLLQAARSEQAQLEEEARQAAREIAVAVDREIAGMVAALRAFATSAALRAGDLAAFDQQAREVAALQGANVVVRDLTGQQLVNTRLPWGAPLPAIALDIDRRAIETQAPQVSGYLVGAVARAPLFLVELPVLHNGEVAYLLSLSMPLEALQTVLWRADVAFGWIGSILDADGRFMARTLSPERFLGGTPAPAALAVIAQGPRGTARLTSAEGIRNFSAFHRVEVSGWTAGVGVPEDILFAPLYRSVRWFGLLAVVALALSTALALVVGRRIAGPIHALARAATEVGRGEPVTEIGTSVREIAEVGEALGAAAVELRRRAAERDDLLRALDRSPAVVRRPDGTILFWGAGAERLYGWSPEEAIGRFTHQLLATQFPRPLAEIEAALLERGIWEGELRHRRRDGSAVVVTSQWALRRDPVSGDPLAIVEINTDMTAVRAAEAELRASEERFRLLVDGVEDYSILMLDPEGRVISWNSGAERIFGWHEEEIVGRHHSVLHTPAQIAAGTPELEIEQARARGRAEDEGPRMRRDGREFLAHVTITALVDDETGALRGFAKVTRDVSERKQAERRLQELQNELIHVSRLSEMSQMGTQLAHELNQPLAAVSNYLAASRRLLDRADAAERIPTVREALRVAGEQSVRAGQIIKRLREFIGRGETDQRVEDVTALIREAGGLALLGARERGVKVEMRFAPEAPTRVFADRIQIQQVLVNLIRNAVEAMESVARRELLITTRPADGGMVEIAVADTGTGIDPEIASRLFEPFATTKPSGMGIGLSVCRTIVEAHGGTIAVAPNPAGGTVFRFTLPAAADDEERRDAA